ncbi:MAG: response regulator [Byssovorax sp.]
MTATILVVEDERIIAADIQQTLIALGYLVPLSVATGKQAIAAAVESHPDLVLMDISLGGAMDGIEAARRIREQLDVPIVYLTSYSDEATLARAMKTAPHGYLLKPFNDRDLRITIEVALSKHRMEALLAERERWFSTTLECLGEAVVATDRTDKVTFLNGVAERLTGWKRADALGKKIGEVIRLVEPSGAPIVPPPDDPAQPRSFAARLPRCAVLLPREGAQIDIDDHASAIIDDQGRVLGAVVVFRDITERREMERRLAQSERLATIGTMAASTAHEINNPLAYVIANVAVTREGIQSALTSLRALPKTEALQAVVRSLVEGEEALREASDGADRVRAIVRDLKKFSRVDESERALLDLPEILDAAARMSDGVVRNNAVFHKEYGTTPYVEANAGQLTQVFTNLLVNAAEAIGEGDAARHGIRIVSRVDDAGRAVVEIHDTGPGIAPAVLGRVFDPFFTTKASGGGTGLGLAICQRIVTALGGELTVESELGKGSIFRVALPPAPSRSPSAEVQAAANAVQPGRRGKILVIDDDAAVARALSRLLRGEHDVEVVNDARAGLAKIAADSTYDVIFCDLMMPNMTGMDFHESLLAAHPELARRIVFMSGGTFSQRAQEFVESTSNVVISKPFASEAVRKVARDYVT